jgi:hypothetical protein
MSSNRSAVLLALALCIISTDQPASRAPADDVVKSPRVTSPGVVADNALAVLDTHCARCHQHGRLATPPPATVLGNILRLDSLANAPHLVQRGNPDASPVYTSMLRGHRPSGVQPGTENAPSPREIAAVRAWIESLPPDRSCRDHRTSSASPLPGGPGKMVQAAMEAARAKPGVARHLRFVSLAHLDDGCTPPETLSAYHQAIAGHLASIAPDPARKSSSAVGTSHTLLALDLDSLGWSAEQWESLIEAGGSTAIVSPRETAKLSRIFGTSNPIVTADWLAANLTTDRIYKDILRIDRPKPEQEPRDLTNPASTIDGVAPLLALASRHAHPLGAARAAAELGIAIEEVAKIADDGSDPASVMARRLLQGVVTRAEFDAGAARLRVAIGRPSRDNSAPPGAPSAAVAPSASSEAASAPTSGLVLYSNKARYRVGDRLSVTVRTDRDCDLTIVNIDRRGRGTVLYPNDFENGSRLAPGQQFTLPAANAGYSFRMNEPGRERIVALCNETDTATDGIRHDFERQRFTDLGDYGAFLRENAHAAVDGGDTSRDDSRQRARRRSSPLSPPGSRPEQITQTAIVIVVD